jgi:hypothetical protein
MVLRCPTCLELLASSRIGWNAHKRICSTYRESRLVRNYEPMPYFVKKDIVTRAEARWRNI